MELLTRAVEKPSEIYLAMGPLQPSDILRMKMMNPNRKVEFLRTIYGIQALPYAKHQYRLLTGIVLGTNRKRKKVERSTN